MSTNRSGNELYTQTALEMSELMVRNYSTSFSLATRWLSPTVRTRICGIYGFVRLVDELVDTLRPDDMAKQLGALEQETAQALQTGMSTNMTVHAFAQVARSCRIELEFIRAFFKSMRVDIGTTRHQQKSYDHYVYGSAAAVGLMCLRVFCVGDRRLYPQLAPGARALGAAFQKINFLRDFAADYQQLGRIYFPKVSFKQFSASQKSQLELEIAEDLALAKTAIGRLPASSRYGVWLAYEYFVRLLATIQTLSVAQLKRQRVSLSKYQKLSIVGRVWLARSLHIRPRS